MYTLVCTEYGQEPPVRSQVLRWTQKFKETGSVADQPRSGRPSTANVTIDEIREKFERSPLTSVRAADLQIGLNHSSVQRVVKNRLKLFP